MFIILIAYHPNQIDVSLHGRKWNTYDVTDWGLYVNKKKNPKAEVASPTFWGKTKITIL